MEEGKGVQSVKMDVEGTETYEEGTLEGKLVSGNAKDVPAPAEVSETKNVELKSNKDVPNPDGSEPMEVDGTEVSKVVGQGETGSGEVKKSDEESKAATVVASVGDSSTENASGVCITDSSVPAESAVQPVGTTSIVPAASSDVSPVVEKSVTEQVNSAGEKDSEGFLPPPPASTLLIRRSRVGSTGATTYVVSPSIKSEEASGTTTSIDGEQNGKAPVLAPQATGSVGSHKTPASGKPSAMSFQTVKRRPGRPVGSVGKYKKRVPVEPSTEVRTSERARARYDYDSPAVADDSPWIYPTNFRASYLSGGKPPMTGNQGGYSKGKKHGVDSADPLTGKRKYMRRKKYGFDKRSYYREDIEQNDQSVQSQHLSDKGIWRPTDDLRLIINTIATGDLESVYVGVKFSCFFSYKEIEERWRKLMYGDKASLVSQNAINGLHPYVKAKIYYECLFSAEEEKLISSIEAKPNSPLDIKAFQTLLDENPLVFNKYRTPRSLMMHWQDMKDYHLHPSQDPLKFKPSEHFECFESLYNCDIDEEDDLEEPDDPVIEQEILTEDRSVKKHIRLLEDETAAWQKLVDQMMNDGSKDKSLRSPFCNEFDYRTYAVLKGRDVHFAMASREIVIGRATPESKVDANLVEESSCRKISRKQAVIRLKDMGRFVIINKGTLPIFVDRKIVPFKCAARLHDHSVIQVGSIGLIFIINRALIDHIVEQDMQREIYESFKDLEKDYPPVPNNTVAKTSTAPTSVKGKGKLGFASGLESAIKLQSKIKSASKPKVNASPAGASLQGPVQSRSYQNTLKGSTFLNLDAAIAKQVSRAEPSTGSKPAATASNSASGTTSDDSLVSNFTVPIITSVSSLSNSKQEPLSSVTSEQPAYSTYTPQSNSGKPKATSSNAKPKEA